jgi:hypothetical protein
MISLVIQVQDRETDPACRAEFTHFEQNLVAGQQSLAQLEDHLTALRKLERQIDRLVDQAQVSAVRLP